MLGKLTLAAIPFDQPIPLIAGAVVIVVVLAVVAWIVLKGHLPYLWHEWITSVDHKRIGVMYILLGMVTQLYLKADRPGDFYGESAQYSGDGFSDMHFVLHAVPADAFAQWVAGARASGPVLDRAGYLALLQESQNNKPQSYRSVEPNLFDAIVRQQLPQGPGPQKGSGGPQVRPIGDR